MALDNITFRCFNKWKHIAFVTLVLVAYGCNATKYLKDGELLVIKNDVKVESDLPVEMSSILEYELLSLPKQKPNKENIIKQKSRLKRYYKIQRRLEKNNFQDTTKIQKWFLNNYVEKPVLYDRALMESSTEIITYALNNQGYFYAEVTADTILNKRKPTVEVVYKAKIGHLLTIENIKFETTDDSLQSVLPIIQANSFLKKGKPISKTIFNNEKNRITKELQNMGFAYFYPNYIFFEGDTTTALLKADVKVMIAPPSDSTNHLRYKIGNIYIYTQYDPVYFRPGIELDTLVVEGYEGFYLLKTKQFDKYLVKPKPILNAFEFKKGDWYSADAYELTRKQFSGIEIYGFVRTRSTPNPDKPEQIDFYIYMNPSKNTVLGANLELNSITTSASDQQNTVNNLGIYGNISYKHRNLLRGAEVFNASSTTGIELNLKRDTRLLKPNTIDVRFQADLASPTIKSERFINGSRLHLTLGYSYISRFLLYKQNSFTLSGGLNWRLPNTQYSANAFTNLALINPTKEFKASRLDNNPLLAGSFERQLIFGSNYNYNHTSTSNAKGESHKMMATAEIAGTLINLLDNVINQSKSFLFFDTISYSQYSRFEIDRSYTRRFNDKVALATRFDFGIGVPYGNSTNLPYSKQFSSGGAASIRAWQIRDIGPGAYVVPYVYAKSTPPFQAGNIRLELNVEYRFPISRYAGFDGALFVDAGNIWLLDDTEDVNGLLQRGFKFNTFWKQIAVGSGFGFRRDFGFFLFRLDLGYKIMTPYKSELNTYFDRLFPREWWRNPNYIIAIDYPF